MGDVKLNYTAESTQARKEIDKVRKENLKLKKSLQDVAKSSKQFSREAKRAYEQTRTPQERYNRKISELATLYSKARISHGTYTRSVKQARQELDRAGKAGQRAHGPLSLRNVGAMALGYIGVSKAIGLAVRALGEMDAKEREIAQRQREARVGLGILQQVSATPEEYAARVKKAKEMHAKGVGLTEGEAGTALFRIISANQEKYADLYAQLAAKAVIQEPGELAKSVATLQSSMGKAAGTPEQIIGRAIVAGAASPATTEEIAQAAGRAGVVAKQAGVSSSELLAATSIAATGTGEAALGGTLIRRLLTEFTSYRMMSEKELGKRGITPELLGKMTTGPLAQRLEAMEAAGGLKLPEFKDIRGQQRAMLGYLQLVENLPKLRALTGEVETAPGRGVLETKLGMTRAVPQMMATEAARTAKGRLTVAETTEGVYASFANAIERDVDARMHEAGFGRFDRWLSRTGAGITRKVMGAEAFAETFAGQGGAETRELYGQTQRVWREQRRKRQEARMLEPFGGDREAFRQRWGGYPEEGMIESNRLGKQWFRRYPENAPPPPPLIGPNGPTQPGGGQREVTDPQANAELQRQTVLLRQIARTLPGSRSIGPVPFTEPVG